jgi:glucosamine--fructose-6-phosphate aminotransferase (isomerizing)
MTLASCLDDLPNLAQFLLNSPSLYLLSPLSSLSYASEIALKLKETLYIHAEAFLAGNFSHGPMALVNNQKDLKLEEKTKVICLLVGEEGIDRSLKVVNEAHNKGAWVLVVTDQSNLKEKGSLADREIKIPYLKHLGGVLALVVLQVLVLEMAEAKGGDVDNPRNITKFVVV